MGRIIPYVMENKIHVPNHQAEKVLKDPLFMDG